MSEKIVLEPIISEDPFTGTKTVAVIFSDCPAIDILIHHKFRVPGPIDDDDYHLTIFPIAYLNKDGSSDGGLIFSSRLLQGDVAQIQILFDDNSIIQKEVNHVSGNDYHWVLTDEDCESFLFKKVKIIRVNSGKTTYDYHLDAPEGLEVLYKDLADLIPVMLEEFLKLAAEEAKWAPLSTKKKEVSAIENNDDSFADNADYCYVYLMNDTANGYYKIGMSNSPEYRESTLQSEKPTIVKVCQKMFPSRKIAHAIESALHRVYENSRIRGEWFILKEQDIWEIKQTLS